MPPVTQTGPCSRLPLAVILAPRARPRHNGFVVHAWLHRAGCRAVRTGRSWRGIVPITHLAREGRMTVTIGRRELLAALGGAAAAWVLVTGGAHAQSDFPNRHIHMIVPYPAGGIVDIATRIVTDKLSEIWRQPIVVETKPGASGNLAWDQVSRAKPDGYTWTFLGPATMANPHMY